jgi:hypothetical protein
MLVPILEMDMGSTTPVTFNVIPTRILHLQTPLHHLAQLGLLIAVTKLCSILSLLR